MKQPRFTFHACKCGNPAARKKNGDWVCERCDELEKRMRGVILVYSGYRDRGQIAAEKEQQR